MPSNKLTLIINTVFLVTTVWFAFYWSGNFELSNFSSQAIGLLVLLYFVNYLRRSKTGEYSEISKLVDSLTITMVILLVVLTTGGLQSPAIFLIFILATFISLILHPLIAVFVITLTAILLERDATMRGLYANTYQFYIWLAIPAIITFISKQYIRLLEDQNKIKIIETQEKILEKEVAAIESDISTFTNQSLTLMQPLLSGPYKDHPTIKALYEAIKNLPDKIDEEAGK